MTRECANASASRPQIREPMNLHALRPDRIDLRDRAIPRAFGVHLI
jgi:hypothetical protein